MASNSWIKPDNRIIPPPREQYLLSLRPIKAGYLRFEVSLQRYLTHRTIWFLVAFSGTVLSCSLHAKPRLSGYYEPSLRLYNLQSGDKTQLENRLRSDLKASISPGVSFCADVVFQSFSGLKSLEYNDILPEHLASYGALLPPIVFEDRIFLDNAYVSFTAGGLDLRLGRQPISYGTAYLYNPTDLVNLKQTFDPTYEKPGVDALRIQYFYRGSGNVELVAIPGEELENWDLAVRIRERLFHFDTSALFVIKRDTLTFSAENRRAVGWTFVGSLLGLGVWGEGAYNWMESTRDFSSYVLGLDYTLNSGLYLMCEYYRDELGEMGKEEYDLFDWMRIMQQGGSLGRDRLFIGGNYPFTSLWKGALFSIINLNDHSFALNPWLYWYFREDVEIDLTASLPWGDDASEFGETPRAGLFRVRVYF